MANKSKYKFTESVPVVTISGYFPEGKEGLLVMKTLEVQGLQPFGPKAGVITEDDLTDELVEEFFMKRRSAPAKNGEEGALIYKDCFALKDGGDAKKGK